MVILIIHYNLVRHCFKMGDIRNKKKWILMILLFNFFLNIAGHYVFALWANLEIQEMANVMYGSNQITIPLKDLAAFWMEVIWVCTVIIQFIIFYLFWNDSNEAL